MILKRINDETLWENNGDFRKLVGNGFDGSPVMELDEVSEEGKFTYIHYCDFKDDFEIIDYERINSKYVLLYICDVDKDSFTRDRLKLLEYYKKHKKEIDLYLFENYKWIWLRYNDID